jgi:4-hydroxyphenylpyruvate dioxygenase-like putative hemolysin
MTKLEELEKSVASLPKAELDQFVDWFESWLATKWDRQIEIDADNGTLNSLAESALSAHRLGQTTPL